MVSGTSKKTELKLVSVARASLEELLQDYQDFLRQHSLSLWDKEHTEARKIRAIAYVKNRSYTTYKSYFEQGSAEVAANTATCLIHQANYLLDQQMRTLQQEFLEKGGFTERLYSARAEIRKSSPSGIAAESPLCPECGASMRNRTARTGINAGRAFWGCSKYPDCGGIKEMKKE